MTERFHAVLKLSMIKSPLRYPGGKARVAERIAELLPAFDEYREPFAGGASVFLLLRQKFPEKTFWINDVYPELATFWSMLAKDSRQVIEYIISYRQRYHNGKELYGHIMEHIRTLPDAERAAAFFIINRITFSGTSESGGYSEQAFNGRFTPSSIERLTPVAALLRNVRITNLDYADVLTAQGNNVVMYLDPPYYSARSSALYGKNGKLHTGFNHERLAEHLRATQHRWLITYDDSPFIRSLYSFANIREWNIVYGMRNVTSTSTQKARELFISNYELPLIV